jgi:hypothetical protein
MPAISCEPFGDGECNDREIVARWADQLGRAIAAGVRQGVVPTP